MEIGEKFFPVSRSLDTYSQNQQKTCRTLNRSKKSRDSITGAARGAWQQEN